MTGSWRDQGNCAGDLDWLDRHWSKQLADCADCPVRAQCLQQALADEEAQCRADARSDDNPAGPISHLVAAALPVWGGMLIRDRAAILAGRLGIIPAKIHKLPTERPSCGTNSGYELHRQAHETPCEPCRAAARERSRARRAAAKTA